MIYSEYLLIFCPIFYFMVIRQSTVLVFAIIFLAEVALILCNGSKVLQNPKTEGWSNYSSFLLDLTPCIQKLSLWQGRRNIQNVSWE